MYTIERNGCKCHPETCCCNDYVIMKENKKIITVFDRPTAELVVKALNKNNKITKEN